MLTRFVRNNLADHIIYQSRFCLERWDSYAGKTTAPSTIIYNGVDLQQFSPDKERRESKDPLRIINVEGTQGADPYDIIINLGMNLRRRGINFEIMMFGAPWNNASARFARHSFIRYMGHIARSQLADYYRSADFFIPTDIWGAGCPNSVLEALACGVPVLGYQAGVLPELLDETSGRCVPCEGGHFVQGRSPGNWDALADAALELLHDKDRLRIGARNLAEKRYDVDSMVDKYIRILFQ
jgi:glycosyltransferase involved in cell wall biosynthesis